MKLLCCISTLQLLSVALAFTVPSRRGRVSFVVAPRYSTAVFSEEVATTEEPSEPTIPEESAEVVAEASSEETSEAAAAAEDDDDEQSRKVERVRHTLFVGNLPFDSTDVNVRDLFAPFGTVVSVNVPKNRDTGDPRGFGFVDMGSAEELEAAISGTDQTTYGGRVIRVNKSLPKDQVAKGPKRTSPRAEPEGCKKIYVGNLPFDLFEQDLMDHFSQYGEIAEFYMPTNRETGQGRGFAFVTMQEEEADKAIEELNGSDFQGRPIVVSVPLPPGEKMNRRKPDSRLKLYIGNLSFYTVADTVRELFEEFGTVHDCYIPEDFANGGSRGFGFVTMEREAALEAVRELDGCEIDGRLIRVNEAQPKGSRRSPPPSNDDFGDGMF